MKTGILLGVVAMFGWGIADFLAARASRTLGTLPTFFWNQLGGLACLVPLLPLVDWSARWTLADALWLSLASLLLAAVYVLFYRALRIGLLAVVSPVLAANVVITAAIGLALFGERLAPHEAAGTGAVILGLLAASCDWRAVARAHRASLTRGVPEALVAMLLAGVVFAVLAWTSRRLGWVAPVIWLRAGGLFAGAALIAARGALAGSARGGLRLAMPSGVFDSLAFVAYSIGVRAAPSAAVAPLGGSFPLVTVLLAIVFLRERPAANQLAGGALVVLGIGLMA
jgi:drug/metabolite transporter (DMT)-like permease